MSDKAVIITGGSGGIGSALVENFAKQGWRVISTGRKENDILPETASFIRADLEDIATNDETLKSFKEKVLQSIGNVPVKALINNAAVQIVKETKDITAKDMQSSFAVNVIAPFRLSQVFLPELARNKGSILNIGTVHEQATKPGFVAYATSKTALHGLTRALAIDLGEQVRVNTLAPAAVNTPMLMEGFKDREDAFKELENFHPMKRIGDTNEIAEIALFLCSDAASFMTGSTLHADGGILSRLHDPV